MIGERLGQYRILSELGSGGMGTVFLAEGDDARRVAVKVVHPHLLTHPGFFKRFLREADLGRRVRDEHVVRTLDADAVPADGGKTVHFLVMEYVEGQTLRGLLAELGKVPEKLCRHIATETAKGLEAIHAVGAVHRDLKPENVLITADHLVKVMDLGTAHLMDAAIRLSQTGGFVGSIRYAAPEQWELRGEIDARTDLYALGILLHELSTGRHPRDVEQSLAQLNPQLSPFFEELVGKLMADDRERRFPSAERVRGILEEGEESAWWREHARSLRAATSRPLRRIRIPRETALYARDAEVEHLRRLHRRAAAGEGRVALIEGEAGIGKTRLVDEVVAQLVREGEDVHFLFGAYPPGGAATVSGAFSTAYREHFGRESLEPALQRYLAAAPALVPAFAALLNDEPPPGGAEPLTKDSLQAAFVRVTRALAAERPVVILIDDLHFAPEEGRALFASLAAAIQEERVLLIGTTRSGLPLPWLTAVERLGHVARLTLTRLGPKELGRLLEEALGSGRLAEELGWRIARKSDGNPFFVFEIIREMRRSGVLRKNEDGSWVASGVIQDITVPSAVIDLVRSWISRLEPADKDLLDVAACCGFEFDPSLVAEAAGAELLPALKRFAHIENSHELVRAAGRNYVFHHHQVQEALYSGLFVQLREQYHAAIGDALERRGGAGAVELCRHFLHGSEPARALPYLSDALRHLAQRHLTEDGLALTGRALEIQGLLEGPERVRVLLARVDRLSLMGRRDEGRTALDEAAALAEPLGDDQLRSMVERSLGTHFVYARDEEAAQEHYERSRELAVRAGDRKMEGHAERGLGIAAERRGRYDDAVRHGERAMAAAHELGDEDAEAAVSINIGQALMRLGRLDDAEAMFRRGEELARKVGNRRWEAAAVSSLAGVHHGRGQAAEALEQVRRAYRVASEIGDRRGALVSASGAALVLSRFGALAEARAECERVRALAVELSDRDVTAYAEETLGWIAEQEEKLEEADLRYVKALEYLAGSTQREREAEARLARARIAWKRGDEAPMRQLLAGSALRDATPDIQLLASAYGLWLGGGAPAVPEEPDGVRPETRLEFRWVLWKATGDAAHLREAHRLLLEMRDRAPEAYRRTLVEGTALHRAIAEAASALE